MIDREREKDWVGGEKRSSQERDREGERER